MDATDGRLLIALACDPRATVLSLADDIGVSRNTVHARLAAFERRGDLTTFEQCIDPGALGLPLTAFVTVTVTQRELDAVAASLENVPEVLEVFGISGPTDLLARVVARDADDLYRIAGMILATSGVIRTETALVMRRLVNYRLTHLLRQLADS